MHQRQVHKLLTYTHLYKVVCRHIKKQKVGEQEKDTFKDVINGLFFVGLPKVFCGLGYNIRKELHFHTSYSNITNGYVEEDNRSFSLGHGQKNSEE